MMRYRQSRCGISTGPSPGWSTNQDMMLTFFDCFATLLLRNIDRSCPGNSQGLRRSFRLSRRSYMSNLLRRAAEVHLPVEHWFNVVAPELKARHGSCFLTPLLERKEKRHPCSSGGRPRRRESDVQLTQGFSAYRLHASLPVLTS